LRKKSALLLSLHKQSAYPEQMEQIRKGDEYVAVRKRSFQLFQILQRRDPRVRNDDNPPAPFRKSERTKKLRFHERLVRLMIQEDRRIESRHALFNVLSYRPLFRYWIQAATLSKIG